MLLQIWAEIRKIIGNRWIWLAFIAVLLISYATSSVSDVKNQYQGLSDEQELLEGNRAYWYMQEIGKEYEGVMDPAWFNKVEDDYTTALQVYLSTILDIAKMQEMYGDDWINDYIANEKNSIKKDVLKEPSEQTEKDYLLFYKEADTSEAAEVPLRYSFLSLLRTRYAQIIETRSWDQPGNESNQVTNFIGAFLNEEDVFYYGNSDGWNALVSLLSNHFFLLSMFFILISSNLFNKEKHMQMMEMIRTSKYGKQKCAIAKMIAVTLTAWLFVLLLFVIDTFYIGITMGLGNWQVHAMTVSKAITPFTFQQVYFYAIGIYAFAAFLIVQICSMLSCLLKSSYLSLLLSTAVIILPEVLPGQIFDLFPIRLLNLTDTLLGKLIITVADRIYFIKDFALIWIIPILICMLITYTYYKSYQFLKD